MNAIQKNLAGIDDYKLEDSVARNMLLDQNIEVVSSGDCIDRYKLLYFLGPSFYLNKMFFCQPNTRISLEQTSQYNGSKS